MRKNPLLVPTLAAGLAVLAAQSVHPESGAEASSPPKKPEEKIIQVTPGCDPYYVWANYSVRIRFTYDAEVFGDRTYAPNEHWATATTAATHDDATLFESAM